MGIVYQDSSKHLCVGKGDCKDPGIRCAGNGKCKTPPFCGGHAAVIRKQQAGCPKEAKQNTIRLPREAVEALSRPWWER